MPENKTYKILSLDGGGSWAIIQVKCLRKLYANIFGNTDPSGHEVLALFDLVAANSGGSLVTAAMAENMRLSEIEKIFDDRNIRSKVFSKLGFFEKSLLSSTARIFKIGAKYATTRKHSALKDILPKVAGVDLQDVSKYISLDGIGKTHLLIVGYDYYKNRAEMFRTDCNSLASTSNIERKLKGLPAKEQSPNDCKVSLVEAIHASSTAPVNYFNQPAIFPVNGKNKYYWDGAVTGNNNPVLTGVVEAKANRSKFNFDKIQVLSIGTGTVSQLANDEESPVKYAELKAKHEDPGLINDIQKMGTSILNDPPDMATFVAYTFLNPEMPAKPVDFIRMNPNLRPVWTENSNQQIWDLPVGISKDDYVKLNSMDMDAVEDAEVGLIKGLCDNWLNDLVPNQSVRSDSKLNTLIGHANFSLAAADFKSWFSNSPKILP